MTDNQAALTRVIVRAVTFPGYWGKGKTEAEAATNFRKEGGRNGEKVYVMAVDETAYIDGMGDLVCNRRGPMYVGKLTNLGVTKNRELYRV